MSVSLRADSPRCCSSRQPGCGSPIPQWGFPLPHGLMRQAVMGGPRTGSRFTHQRGSPAKSRPLLGRPSPRDWTHTGRIVLRGRKCWVPLTETLELAGVSSSFVVSQV